MRRCRHGSLRGVVLAAFALGVVSSFAGPYSKGFDDPFNGYDAPIPGFVGPDGEGKARLDDGFGGFTNPRNYPNPIFLGWATTWTDYVRADGQEGFSDPTLALGPVTGDVFDVLALGDLSAAEIGDGKAAGQVTLQFTGGIQTQPIRNLPGADFVVFENGTVASSDTGGAGVGGVFAELGYVEVSSDGVNFARFPSISQTAGAVGMYGSINPTNVFNLAGKHVNAYGNSWGTPFDLADLTGHPSVVSGAVNLAAIRYVRVVDIPGNGTYLDSNSHSIYDAWVTFGSGGVDLEAVGAISVEMTFEKWQDFHALAGIQRGVSADPDGDGVANLIEYAFAMRPLVGDAELMPSAERLNGTFAMRFRRDMRAMDVKVEVYGTADLHQPWTVIARALPGAALAAVNPFTPAIEDAPASHIASIGVVRRHQVAAAPGMRFLRVSVSLLP